MMMELSRPLKIVGMLVALSLLGGCGLQKLKSENAALHRQNQELQDELNRARGAADAASSSQADRSALVAEINRLQKELEEAKKAGPAVATAGAVRTNTAFAGIEGVETITTPGAVTVRVPGDVLFSSGKITLKPQAIQTLDKIAGVIKSRYADNTIRVLGYTDTDPIRKSRWADNLELSLQRAAAVHRELQKMGISGEQMEAVGKGPWHPEATKAKSRRVEIVVVMTD